MFSVYYVWLGVLGIDIECEDCIIGNNYFANKISFNIQSVLKIFNAYL